MSHQRMRIGDRIGQGQRVALLIVVTAFTLGLLLFGHRMGVNATQPSPRPGYGANVAAWDVERLQEMGFNWVKVFNLPAHRMPLNVLIRLEAGAVELTRLSEFGQRVGDLARSHGSYIEAYEIGNESNLDASYGWGAPPVAADYVALLCEAYEQIKQHDPGAVVVSAGLAPVGRVQGNWNGHAGHKGAYQDEREYLREFLAAGGGACADAIGYHPYGFSARYDAEPDTPSSDPAQNCTNGFCFRGVEKIYEIMAGSGWGQKEVWATEFGWIVTPPDSCLAHPSFQGRGWQLVSEQEQADNLVGAYTYAAEQWPWMGALFVFNLNFNQSDLYEECEQMRYYAIQGRPAEEALSVMPKQPQAAMLAVSPASITLLEPVGGQPFTRTRHLLIENEGGQTLYYTATSDLWLTPPPLIVTGTVAAGASAPLAITLSSEERPAGPYTTTLTITARPGTEGAPIIIPVSLLLVEKVERLFLPVAVRSFSP